LSADRIISGRSGIALVNDGNYLYVDYTGAIASSSAASYLSFDNFGNSGTGVLDDNFDGSSINAKWSGMGTGLLTNINQNYGAINMYENSTSSVRARALVQALPTSSTGNFFITKVSPSLNFAYAYDGGGIVFYNSGTSKYYLGGGIIHSSTNFQGYSAYFATTGATSATNETIGGGFTYPQSPFYIKAGMSGANFVVGYSLNGSSFRLFDSSSAATTIANMGTPTHVGIMFHRLRNSASNDKSAWSFDFFKETTDSTFY
jgi:hypothetical protein